MKKIKWILSDNLIYNNIPNITPYPRMVICQVGATAATMSPDAATGVNIKVSFLLLKRSPMYPDTGAVIHRFLNLIVLKIFKSGSALTLIGIYLTT